MIQRELVDKLALKLLEGDFADGDVVKVGTTPDGELAFERDSSAVAQVA